MDGYATAARAEAAQREEERANSSTLRTYARVSANGGIPWYRSTAAAPALYAASAYWGST